MRASRAVIERLIADGAIVYGVTTGFGDLADVRIRPDQTVELQRNLVRSHAAGVGDPLPDEVVRAMLLLRANALAVGHVGRSRRGRRAPDRDAQRGGAPGRAVTRQPRRVGRPGAAGAHRARRSSARARRPSTAPGRVRRRDGAGARRTRRRSSSAPRKGWRSSTGRSSWPASAAWPTTMRCAWR